VRPFGEAGSPEEAARTSIAAYQTMCQKQFSQRAVETLLAAFKRLEHKE